MTELSREAMALLELSPTWQRRERYQDTPIAIQPRGRGVLIALVASDDATRALWQKMISVLVGIGFPRAVFEQSIVVEAAQADALAHRLRTQRPAALMIMGDALLQAAQREDVGLFEGLQVIIAPPLDQCLKDAQAKRQLWMMFSGVLRQLNDEISQSQ